ncbi:TIGR03086 family metal-binding protein [Saccharothrix obliqua]|uniref:TIGR03086 family metal-binding protein n=1 Tax=Saccharothrix obliqua TaxID=2861747 RepID=UPI001C5D3ED3|nr:TIGR03086 family metal-binding protein [Saccharothrix obliqua]MBW4717611.1 TIGR03086 family protein [Saccharothrix obliqua]
MTEFDTRVRLVRPDQWDSSTPCAGWSVHDLVDHLVREQLWAPELLAGCTLAQVGDRFDGDQLGGDPLRSWVLAAAAAREAWIAPNALLRHVDLSWGKTPAVEYGWQMTLDLGVHAWDLARAIGADERLDPDLAATLLRYAEERFDSFSGSGVFGPPVAVPDDASAQDRLVGMLGRQP